SHAGERVGRVDHEEIADRPIRPLLPPDRRGHETTRGGRGAVQAVRRRHDARAARSRIMTLRELLGRAATWHRRDSLERELARELEEHVELLARDYTHEGMAAADARIAARRQLGNVG